jgi:O-antigen ligase
VSELIRALIVVLGLGLPVLIWAEQALCAPRQRPAGGGARGAPAFWPSWVVITVLEFGLPSFPLFLVASAIVVLLRASREPVPMALCLALIAAVPEVAVDLPTFGLVEHLLPISFTLMLTVILLGPLLMARTDRRTGAASGPSARPWALFYLAWLAFINALSGNFTGLLRFTLGTVLTTYVPFAAAARSLRTIEGLHRVLALYVTMMAGFAILGIFEYLKSWLLFAGLPSSWGINFGLLHYLARGSALRAQVATGQPIILGFLLAVALVLALSPALYYGRPRRRPLLITLLAAGLFATVSRGPWLGAVGGVAIYLALAPGGFMRVLKFLAAGAGVLVLFALLPGGEKVIDLLPWVGKADTGSTSYRADLFNAVVPLLLDSPILGVPEYDTRPELQFLRQGEGLIDLVNTYIGVAVSSGLIGLFAFVAIHVRTLLGLWRMMVTVDGEAHELVRAFFAAYVTILLVLATSSTSGSMGFVTWLFVGLGAAITSIQTARTATQPAARHPQAGRRATADPASPARAAPRPGR